MLIKITSEPAKGRFVGVSDIEEAVDVLALVVDFAHERVSLEDVLAVDEEVKRVTLRHLDALADDVAELIGRQIRRREELGALVGRELGGRGTLADDRDLVWVLHADVRRLLLALSKTRNLVLVVLLDGAHLLLNFDKLIIIRRFACLKNYSKINLLH